MNTLSEFERNHPITLYCDCLRPCSTVTTEYGEAVDHTDENPAGSFRDDDK